MQPKSIVAKFVEQLASAKSYGPSIAIKISTDPSLEFADADATVEGFDWPAAVQPGRCFEFVVVDLPLGMGRKRVEVGGSTISVRGNWSELLAGLRILSPEGLCIALVEPPAFGIAEGPKFLEALAREGFYLNGVFNCPPNLLTTTAIRPVIVAFSPASRSNLFLAELETESQAEGVAHAFIGGTCTDSLHEGLCLNDGKFDGFESLKARIQLERLETQYKDYKSHVLGKVAVEMNMVKSGESLEPKNNSIYVPTIGTSQVTDDLSAVTLKHHNVIQVVLSEVANCQYLAAFFRSDLGVLILRALTRGAEPPRVSRRLVGLSQAASAAGLASCR